MAEYRCNHCGQIIDSKGGSAREVGLFPVDGLYYCEECGKIITVELLEWVI